MLGMAAQAELDGDPRANMRGVLERVLVQSAVLEAGQTPDSGAAGLSARGALAYMQTTAEDDFGVPLEVVDVEAALKDAGEMAGLLARPMRTA